MKLIKRKKTNKKKDKAVCIDNVNTKLKHDCEEKTQQKYVYENI